MNKIICVCMYIYTYIKDLSRKSPTIVNILRTVHVTLMSPGSQGEWTGMHMCEQ